MPIGAMMREQRSLVPFWKILFYTLGVVQVRQDNQ
jgi:hypothetical protein